MWRRLFDRAYLSLFREYPQLGALALVTLCAQLAVGLINIYALPKYLFAQWHLAGWEVGLVASTFLASETLLKIPMGWVSDRVGRKPPIVLSTLVTCLNPTIIAHLPLRLWMLVFPIRVTDGAGVAALWPPLYAAVGDATPGRARAAAMSVINTVYIGAIGVAAAVGGFTASLTGSDRAPFYLASGLLFVSSVASYLGLRRRRPTAVPPEVAAAEEEEAEGEEEVEEEAPGEEHGELGAPGAPRYSMALILLLSFLMMLGPLMLATYLVRYLQVDLGLSDSEMGALLLVLGVPVLVLGLPLGRVADRWGPSRAVRTAVVIAAAAMWVLPLLQSVVAFGAAAVAIVLALMFGAPAWLAVVSGLARRRRRGGVMGTVATAEGIGAAIGPGVGGLLWDISHAYIFYGAAAALSLAALVALLTLRAPRRPTRR